MKLNQWLQEQRGRQTALAAHLGVKPPTVSDWGAGQKQVALDHCPAIQDFTDNAVTCEELRPDRVEYFALIRSQALANNAQAATKTIAPMAQGVA